MTRRRNDCCLSQKNRQWAKGNRSQMKKMKIKVSDLIDNDFEVIGDAAKDISGVVYDSRMVKGGELFVAVRGEKLDGGNFIEDAIKKGAVAVMYEHKGPLPADLYVLMEKKYPEVTWIRVADVRDALARVSHRFYGKSSEQIAVLGITGTNGKTTTSYLVKSILEQWGEEVGIIGTINYLIKDAVYEARHTTPEAPDFQSLLREMSEAGCGFVISEISS